MAPPVTKALGWRCLGWFAILLSISGLAMPVAAAWQPGAAPDDSPAGFAVASHFKNAAAASAPVDHAPSATAVAPLKTGGGPAWWTIFHDATLDGLEDQASAANQDLRQTIARIAETRQQALVTAADFYPHLALGLDAARFRTTDTGPVQKARLQGGLAKSFGGGPNALFASQLATSTYNDFRTPFTVSYEVDVFGRIRHSYESARATFLAAEADRLAVALSLSADVATNYFALRAADSQIAVFRRNVGLRQESVHLNQERVTAGVANPLDLTRAKVELDNTQGDLSDSVRQRAEIENNLAALCGQSASDFRLPARPLEQSAPPAVPPGVPSALLARRPDLAEAEWRVTSASEQIGVARAELLPTFNLQGNAGFESAQYEELFHGRSRALSVMSTVNVPIFEGGRNVANLRAARARRDEALASYRSTAITAFKEVENALADMRERATQFEARRRAAADAGEELTLSQRRYIEGAVNYFDVVDAQRSVLSAELSEVETLNARYAAAIALVRALGGGWDRAGQTGGK